MYDKNCGKKMFGRKMYPAPKENGGSGIFKVMGGKKEILDKKTFLREVYAYLKSLRTSHLPVDGHRCPDPHPIQSFLDK